LNGLNGSIWINDYGHNHSTEKPSPNALDERPGLPRPSQPNG
jgi:hypothetical protein